jgi:hypothetical protein
MLYEEGQNKKWNVFVTWGRAKIISVMYLLYEEGQNNMCFKYTFFIFNEETQQNRTAYLLQFYHN